MKNNKVYDALLQAYRLVYAEIGVDFDEIDKVDGFYMNYQLDDEVQQKILNKVINSSKLSRLEKSAVTTSFWLGVSPRGID